MNPPPLAETRAALRREIGPSTHRDHRWQPMVWAGEIRQLLDALDDADAKQGEAWDTGYETAARCYWHKPRNPFTGEMNDDDPNDYCDLHGGVGMPEDCNLNPLSAIPGSGGRVPPCPGPRGDT